MKNHVIQPRLLRMNVEEVKSYNKRLYDALITIVAGEGYQSLYVAAKAIYNYKKVNPVLKKLAHEILRAIDLTNDIERTIDRTVTKSLSEITIPMKEVNNYEMTQYFGMSESEDVSEALKSIEDTLSLIEIMKYEGKTVD